SLTDLDMMKCTAPGAAAKDRFAIGVAALPPSPTQQDLVVVRPAGAHLVHWDGAKLVTTCLTANDDKGAPVSIWGFAVASGDFDGDGIPDIVVSQTDGLDVFYGASIPPGGSTSGATQALVGDGGAP